MESAPNSMLMDIFMQQMVEPVTHALQKADSDLSEGAMNSLQHKIKGVRETLIQEINRIYSTHISQNDDVAQTMNILLDKVEQMEKAQMKVISMSLPTLTYDVPFEQPPETNFDDRKTMLLMDSTKILKPDNVILSSSSGCMDSVCDKAFQANLKSKKHNLTSSPNLSNDVADWNCSKTDLQSSVSSSPENTEKRMSSRKRAKRSLADTVQMLSTDSKKSTKEDATTQLPNILRVPHFSLSQIPAALNIQRWLGTPFTNPLYLNMMFHQPKSSEEQIATLMKMSMKDNFTNNMDYNVAQKPTKSSSSVMELDNVKIDVDSDEGEVEISPSPSSEDVTESESSASSCLNAASPSSGDCESAHEKPFICIHNNCGKRFANKFLLKKHMFIHTGLRPHTCPHCHKKFNRKDNLLRHKKTHSPTGAHLGQILPKVTFPGFAQLPSLHNLSLPTSFTHFHHTLKMSLDTGAPAVRSLS